MGSTYAASHPGSLDELSPEVQLLVMSHLEIESLYALIRALPQQLHVFRSAKELVLSQILRRTFHVSVLPEALAIVRASQLKSRPPDRQHVDTIIQSIKSHKSSASTKQPMSLETCIFLCRLNHTLSYFVNDYTQHTLGALADFYHRRTLSQGSSCNKVDVVLDGPLSITELTRLQRAFCRFELYGYLFGAPKKDVKIGAYEQWNTLLAEFQPWENEELTSIRDYLTRSLCKRFDQVEDDFVQETLKDGSALDGDFPNRWDQDDIFFTYEEKSHDHEAYIEYLLSLGLPFLRQVFEARDKKLRTLILSNARSVGDFLTKAVGQYFRNADIARDREMDAKYGVKLEFEEDSPDDWNAGWMWACGYSSRWDFAHERQRVFRDMGHVFWDYARLEASGLFDQQ